MPIIISDEIIPTVPMVSFDEYNTADPTKIAAERMLPASKIFDLDFAFIN